MERKPRLGCAGIVFKGDTILMGIRAKEPNKGKWILPGGGVNFGETFSETLQRELYEEASINISVREVFKIYELINKPDEHRVIVYLFADYKSGDLVPGSDLSEVKFLSRNEIIDLDKHGLISPFVNSVLKDARLL